jgi:hypothetical protein
MVIEQTVDIPASHRLIFIPTGKAKAALTLTFESENTASITAQLNEVYSSYTAKIDADIQQAQYDLLTGEDW